MAETTTPTPDPNKVEADAKAATQSALTFLDLVNGKIEDVQKAFQNINDTIVQTSKSIVNNLASAFKIVGAEGDNLSDKLEHMQKSHANMAAAVAVQLLGVSEAYKSFTYEGVGGVKVLSDQFQTFKKTLTGMSEAAGLDKLAGLAKNVGLSIPLEVMEEGAQGVSTFIERQLAAADAGRDFRNSLIQTAGSTGGLNDMFIKLGPNLQNTEALITQQNTFMKGLADKTGMTTEQVGNYYNQIIKIPGAMNALVTSTKDGGTATSYLDAAMTSAQGTGRSYEAVITDITKAYDTMGLTGNPALNFTNRMSELSDKLGIKLSVTTEYLNKNADAFQFYGKNAEAFTRVTDGAASIANKLYGSLAATGLSAKNSMGLIEGLTDRIGNMSLAQKAFLSAQTGGPGGLMGGFQIDKMLSEGKTEEVFNKMKETLKKQFGSIVTLDQAASSPELSGQFAKQVSLLRQGPFGQVVKDDQQAYKLLEAFKNERPTTDLKTGESLLADTLSRGETLQKDANTILGQIARNTEAMKMAGSAAAVGFTSGFTELGAGGTELGKYLASMRQMGDVRSTEGRVALTDKNNVENKGLQNTREALKGIVNDLTTGFPAAIKQSMVQIAEFTGFGDKIRAKEREDAMNASLEMQKARIARSTLPEEQKKLRTHEIDVQQAAAASLTRKIKNETDASIASRSSGSMGINQDRKLAAAFNIITAAPTTDKKTHPGHEQVNHTVEVLVKGVCIDCGRNTDESPHVASKNDPKFGKKAKR